MTMISRKCTTATNAESADCSLLLVAPRGIALMTQKAMTPEMAFQIMETKVGLRAMREFGPGGIIRCADGTRAEEATQFKSKRKMNPRVKRSYTCPFCKGVFFRYESATSAAVALGKIKSPKKAAASRKNGKRGGRPAKKSTDLQRPS